jgi:hypothetical protein
MKECWYYHLSINAVLILMKLTTIKVQDSMDHKNINIIKMKVKLGLIFENKNVEIKFEKVISNIKIITYL